jgi:allantoin racemase
MRILLINPNTSEGFTEKVQAIADQYALPTTQAVAVNPAYGPRSIESIYDELLSSAGTLEIALQERGNFDAFVIACYSDHPTVYALREVTGKPVLGIAEASMYVACMLGYKFSVVTTNDAWEPLLWDAVRHYGLAERCASVRTTGMAVLALESDEQGTRSLIEQAARRAIEEDGAEVICLGCAGMSGLDKHLEERLGVPVVDGVIAAVKILEGVAGYGVVTSRRRAYQRPEHKELLNMPHIFYDGYNDRG